MAESLPWIEGKHAQNPNCCEGSSNSQLSQLQRDRLVLQLAELVVRARKVPDAFNEIAPRILSLLGCDFLRFSLHDPGQDCMITQYWTSQESGDFDAFAIDECISGWVWKQQEGCTIPDVDKEKRFPVCTQELRKHGVRSYSMLPLTSGTRRFGALGIGKKVAGGLNPDDSEFFERLTFLVSLALENREAHQFSEERRNQLQGLVAIAQELTSSLELDHLLLVIVTNLRKIRNCRYAIVSLLEEDKKSLRVHAADWAPGLGPLSKDARLDILQTDTTARRAIEARVATIWSGDDLDRMGTPDAKEIHDAGIQSVCNVPLICGTEVLGSLNLGSLEKRAFTSTDAGYLQRAANLIAASLRNAKAYRELGQFRDRLTHEKRYLEGEIRNEMRWDEIVGRSRALKCVLDNAAIVAATDSTVLITGETGTGKERVARAIHAMSRRKERSFIKLNCAAIPTGLLESELFGHEKGAFTGAVSQKIGRLELADKGTLFLDEIGEIAPELQPKLLRVLQDQEFERLGGTRTIRVDARLIAATNRDLASAVDEGQFRSDLFYRLHVFPVHLPALRDRSEDIPELVQHFVEKSSARLGRRVSSVPKEALDAMIQWTWPGNIRELENFIERSVILSNGPVLRAPLAELRQEIARQRTGSDGTLRDRERDHIIEVLRQTRGLLSGPRGAAARLGLKRTTLQYKLQKLGISRTEYLD
jgi:formate hydrogenlyase transcriptional activator